MSTRRGTSATDPLGAFVRDMERRVRALEAGVGRGPNSSWGLPFQIGNWLWFEEGGQLCVRNVVTGVRHCVDTIDIPATSSSDAVCEYTGGPSLNTLLTYDGSPSPVVPPLYEALGDWSGAYEDNAPYCYRMGDGNTSTWIDPADHPVSIVWRLTGPPYCAVHLAGAGAWVGTAFAGDSFTIDVAFDPDGAPITSNGVYQDPIGRWRLARVGERWEGDVILVERIADFPVTGAHAARLAFEIDRGGAGAQSQIGTFDSVLTFEDNDYFKFWCTYWLNPGYPFQPA